MLDLKPDLSLTADTAFFILLKAREFAAKVEDTDPDEGSNPTDDRSVDVLEFQADDTAEAELTGAIGALNEDERLDLIALAWIGRGDFSFDEWAAARDGARMIDPGHAPAYLREMPGLSEYLEDALSQIGLSLEDHLDTGIRSPLAPELGPTES